MTLTQVWSVGPEVKMLRRFLGETRVDGMRNEHLRGTTKVGRLETVSEASLRRFGRVQAREEIHGGAERGYEEDRERMRRMIRSGDG